MFYFCHSENLPNVMKNTGNISNSNSLYIVEKNSFVSKFEKQICYQKNKFLFFMS